MSIRSVRASHTFISSFLLQYIRGSLALSNVPSLTSLAGLERVSYFGGVQLMYLASLSSVAELGDRTQRLPFNAPLGIHIRGCNSLRSLSWPLPIQSTSRHGASLKIAFFSFKSAQSVSVDNVSFSLPDNNICLLDKEVYEISNVSLVQLQGCCHFCIPHATFLAFCRKKVVCSDGLFWLSSGSLLVIGNARLGDLGLNQLETISSNFYFQSNQAQTLSGLSGLHRVHRDLYIAGNPVSEHFVAISSVHCQTFSSAKHISILSQHALNRGLNC